MAKAVELTGTLWFVGNTESVSDGMNKRIAWIRIDEDTEYPQIVETEFIKDKCDLLNKYNPGDKVTIDVNIRGRVVNKKDGSGSVCFNSLNAWRIRGLASGEAKAPRASAPLPPMGSGATPPPIGQQPVAQSSALPFNVPGQAK